MANINIQFMYIEETNNRNIMKYLHDKFYLTLATEYCVNDNQYLFKFFCFFFKFSF